jgi:hypothetical protein
MLVGLLLAATAVPASAGTATVYITTTSTGGTKDYTFSHPALTQAICPGWDSAYTSRVRISYGAVTMASIYVKSISITTTVSRGHAASTDTDLYAERDNRYYAQDNDFGTAPPTYTRSFGVNKTIGFTQTYPLTLYHDSYHTDGDSIAANCEVIDFIAYKPKKPPL